VKSTFEIKIKNLKIKKLENTMYFGKLYYAGIFKQNKKKKKTQNENKKKKNNGIKYYSLI